MGLTSSQLNHILKGRVDRSDVAADIAADAKRVSNIKINNKKERDKDILSGGDFLGLSQNAGDPDGEGQDLSYLRPLAVGHGWRTKVQAPSTNKINPRPLQEGQSRMTQRYEPPNRNIEEHNEPGSYMFSSSPPGGKPFDDVKADWDKYMEQYNTWEPQAMGDLIDTISHESGHGATKNLYEHSSWKNTDDFINAKRRYPNERGRKLNQDIQPGNQTEEDDQTARMLAMLDDERMGARARKNEMTHQLPSHRMPGGERAHPSNWHEMAAYTTEYPHHPEYALASYLAHGNVEQEARKGTLKRLAEGQRKWGVKDPINWQAEADALNPKKGWGTSQNIKRLMGAAPIQRPAAPLGQRPDDRDWTPEETTGEGAKKLLLPAGERIYRNLREAIIGQSFANLKASSEWSLDPDGITNQPKYAASRMKMAESRSKEALTMLNRHFAKVRSGKAEIPNSIADLPDSLRGEIARLDLRRILAEQVGQQNDFTLDENWRDPDGLLNVGWDPRTEEWSYEGGNYGNDWRRGESYPPVGLTRGLAAPAGNDAHYIPEDSEYGELRRFLRGLQSEEEDFDEKNPSVDWEIRNTEGNEEYERLNRELKQKRWDLETEHRARFEAEAERLGIKTRKNREGDRIIDIPRYYPPNIFTGSGSKGSDTWQDVDFGDLNAPIQWDQNEYYPSNMMGQRRDAPSGYYGKVPRKHQEFWDSENSDNSYNHSRASKEAYGNQGNYDWHYNKKLSDYSPWEFYHKDRGSSIPPSRNVILDTWEEDDPNNWMPHPLANKKQMKPRLTGFNKPENWELTDKYPYKKRREYEELKTGFRSSPFGRRTNRELVDAAVKQRREKGSYHDSDSFNHPFEDLQGDYQYRDDGTEDNQFFRRKKGVERQQPSIRVPRARFEWDPVQRAISQAFMDRETETVVPKITERQQKEIDEDKKKAEERNQERIDEGRKPTYWNYLSDKEKDERFRKLPELMKPREFPVAGKKWGGSTFEDGPTYDSETGEWELDKPHPSVEGSKPSLGGYMSNFYDELQPKRSLAGYLAGEHKPKRKPLSNILSEIADKRMKNAGYDSWDSLDEELKNRSDN
mgnify:CR=1 FL=1|tara:strand:- start:78271 stop:81507 length:3237 start_codon:yes stop_codon:yes gene_type:complete